MNAMKYDDQYEHITSPTTRTMNMMGFQGPACVTTDILLNLVM